MIFNPSYTKVFTVLLIMLTLPLFLNFFLITLIFCLGLPIYTVPTSFFSLDEF